ncbi:MAG: NAD(P)H-dependent oxidoreductase [Acidimicrobiia bacterium]|nr:NAD(P)H-dependent oxidoreductase [Acidimicrobiia bacterium]
MRGLVVVAHPRAESYTRALADRAVCGLLAAGHEVEQLDLYGLDFQAAMSPEEWRAYEGDEPILDPIVAAHARSVQRVELLVFVYPTWWSGLPAILKGWLERVLVPGVGFRIDEQTGKVQPALTDVRMIVGISTYDSSRSRVAATNDNGRRTLTRALRMNCGARTRTRWYGMYSLGTSTEVERADFAATVERAMLELR